MNVVRYMIRVKEGQVPLRPSHDDAEHEEFDALHPERAVTAMLGIEKSHEESLVC